jgi:hypothetical protein
MVFAYLVEPNSCFVFQYLLFSVVEGINNLCLLGICKFFVIHFPCSYSIFTKNQSQLCAQFSFLLLVKFPACFDHLLAHFRESYATMFQLRIRILEFIASNMHSVHKQLFRFGAQE